MARPDERSRLYRVRLSCAGPDRRAELRQSLMSTPDLERMIERLAAMDRRSTLGPWTLQSLEVIQRRPGRRAPEFAELLGREAQPWKAQLRRLKEFGLTASPPVGYRLSPRGDQVLTAARRRRPRQPVI